MFQRLCTYFQDTGVLIFGGYVLSGHCNQQQISVKTEGVLIFGGVLIYGVLRYYAAIIMIFWKTSLKQSISWKLKTKRIIAVHGEEVRWSWRDFPKYKFDTSQSGNVLQEKIGNFKSRRDRKDRQRRKVVEGAQKEMSFLHWHKYTFKLASNTTTI